MARKKTAEDLKKEARSLLKKARELERIQRDKKIKKMGQWVLKNQTKILAVLPENLRSELADLSKG